MKPNRTTDIFELEILTYWVENDDLLVTISKDVERTLTNIQPLVTLLQRLSNNGKKKICILTDGNLARPFSPEIREFVNAELGKYIKASVMFTETQMGNAMGFIYTTLHGDTFEVKVCANEQEARKWLKDFLSADSPVQRPAEMDAESDAPFE
jgi:hypothetical protein